jgi:hypothetical protein
MLSKLTGSSHVQNILQNIKKEISFSLSSLVWMFCWMCLSFMSCGPHLNVDSTPRFKMDAKAKTESNLKYPKSEQDTGKKIFQVEGSPSPMPHCRELGPKHQSKSSEALYIAKLQGSKSVVKEQCLNQQNFKSQLLKSSVSLDCQSASCSFYDTYRRGPLWFALYMAALNQAFNQGKIIVRSKQDQVQDLSSWRGHRFELSAREEGQTKEVYQQKVKFKLNSTTQCIAIIKVFRDQTWIDKTEGIKHLATHKWHSILPNAGDLWAEARPTSQGGHEVLIIERRYVSQSHQGELLERELLCTSSSPTMDILDSDYRFMTQELNRDTLRVYIQ